MTSCLRRSRTEGKHVTCLIMQVTRRSNPSSQRKTSQTKIHLSLSRIAVMMRPWKASSKWIQMQRLHPIKTVKLIKMAYIRAWMHTKSHNSTKSNQRILLKSRHCSTLVTMRMSKSKLYWKTTTPKCQMTRKRNSSNLNLSLITLVAKMMILRRKVTIQIKKTLNKIELQPPKLNLTKSLVKLKWKKRGWVKQSKKL